MSYPLDELRRMVRNAAVEALPFASDDTLNTLGDHVLSALRTGEQFVIVTRDEYDARGSEPAAEYALAVESRLSHVERALSERLFNLERRLTERSQAIAELAESRDALASRLAKHESEVAATFDAARKESHGALSSEIYKVWKVTGEMRRRLDGLETTSNTALDRLDNAEADLADVKPAKVRELRKRLNRSDRNINLAFTHHAALVDRVCALEASRKKPAVTASGYISKALEEYSAATGAAAAAAKRDANAEAVSISLDPADNGAKASE